MTAQRFHVALVALALGACTTSPGGPEYAELGIRTFQGAQEFADECTPLPVLPGGVVDRDIALAPGLSAHVLATRDSAEVTLKGVDDPSSSHFTFTRAALTPSEEGQGLPAPVDVTVGGESFTVAFLNPCSSSATVTK